MQMGANTVRFKAKFRHFLIVAINNYKELQTLGQSPLRHQKSVLSRNFNKLRLLVFFRVRIGAERQAGLQCPGCC
jgi:hypothetical protein